MKIFPRKIAFPNFRRERSTTRSLKGKKKRNSERSDLFRGEQGKAGGDVEPGGGERKIWSLGGDGGVDREQQRLRPYLVRYRPPLASVSSSSFSSRPTPSFSPERGRGRIDKQGGWQGCNVHDSICRNKIKTALSLSLSPILPSPLYLPFTFTNRRIHRRIYYECFLLTKPVSI